MNIFFVHPDPTIAARQLCDQHVTKMLLESAQLLAAAHHILGGPEPPDAFPAITHHQHPCSRWARRSIRHYRWLSRHAEALVDEFERRFGHAHSWDMVVEWLVRNEPRLDDLGFEQPPQAMPEEFRVDGDSVTAYRKYYLGEKARFARWRHGSPPEWWIQGESEPR